jgi:hypothetical protein
VKERGVRKSVSVASHGGRVARARGRRYSLHSAWNEFFEFAPILAGGRGR